jgi:hypothetical protein
MVHLGIYDTLNSNLPQSYRQGNKTKALYSIQPSLESLKEPADFENSDRFSMAPSCISKDSSGEFDALVDDLFEDGKGKRKEPHLTQFRMHLEQVLLNLAAALLQNKWLMIALDDEAYRADDLYISAGWRFRTMKAVVEYLYADGLIYKRRGKKFKDKPLRTRIYPTPALTPHLIPFVLGAEQSFDSPFVRINRPSESTIKILGSSELIEEPELKKINDFLQQQDWACKGPVRLLYHQDPFFGGRLYTSFQNLPTRRQDIRKRTLINGQPICEVDFSANQLRMQLALFFAKDAGEDPYGEIALNSDGLEKEKVKQFIVVAFGAKSRHKAIGGCWKKGINHKEFKALELATLETYPELKLFDAWTHQAQNLEGQILKKIMLHGVEKDIVCLPVHDAVAVQQRHEQWAVEAMISTWSEVVCSDVKPRVKVDRAGG